MAKICMYGAGSIGCYLGGRLLAAGSDVTLVGRAPMGARLRQHGLVLSNYRGERWQIAPEAIRYATGAAAAAEADLVLVTVKSAASASAAAELAGALRPGALVVSFQNGIGNADVLRAALPDHTVLEGMVPFNVIERAPGAFHQGTAGALSVRRAAGLEPFLAAFGRAGLPLSLHDDMLAVQWAKLLLNLNNAINALANRPLKEELSQRAYRVCLGMAQREALALLREARIRPAALTPIAPDWMPRVLALPDLLFARVARRMLAVDPLARSSMSDDLAAGRTTEVDWINGEVVRLAARLGRAAPVNARLGELVHAAEANGTRPSWSGAALRTQLREAAQRAAGVPRARA